MISNSHSSAVAIMLLNILLVLSSVLYADVVIDITQGVDRPKSIAIVPFAWRGKGNLPYDVAHIVESDLQRTGQLVAVPRDDMLSMPHKTDEVFFRDWRALGVDYLLIGELKPDGKAIEAELALFDVYAQQRLFKGRVNSDSVRQIAHAISDSVYEELTGVPGIFRTKLLYVAVTTMPASVQNGKEQLLYRLIVADSDGERETVILQQTQQPIVTPTWSPKGDAVAYVSFETGRPAIFMQELATGVRTQLTDFSGLNGAPVWSPDGKQLALVLSKDGSPDIYIMDIATRQLKRMTSHFAIDTEPEWMPDGKSLLYTSDRGGNPHIYRLDLATGHEERLTFTGNYNTRARALPDGSGWLMVHRKSRGGGFTVAKQDLKTGVVQSLVSTPLGESATISPNGAMLLYVTEYQGESTLAVMSMDGGRTIAHLPSQFGSVRDPVWGPLHSGH